MSIARTVSGVWTYRSFRNTQGPVGDFSKIKVWEAELLFQTGDESNVLHGHLGQRPDETGPNHPHLTVEGSFHDNASGEVEFRAVGATGTDFEGWVYDYRGFVSPDWKDGKASAQTIVGTVVRSVEHDGQPAGEVFSFVAVKHDFVEPRTLTTARPGRPAIALPPDVLKMVSSENHRLHHQLWHASRDGWMRMSDAKKDAIRNLNWQPGPNGNERYSIGPNMFSNASGEDFLFMHRRMIKMVDDLGDVSGWRRVPSPQPLSSFGPGFLAERVGNPDGFALPPPWVVPGAPSLTDWFFSIRTRSTLQSRYLAWEAQYTDPDYLARVSLGELGARVEFTIHNWMHMRWASIPRDPDTGEELPGGRQPLDFDKKWFQESYDYLGETFSSHVHPVFWRLHRWVDDRINDWHRAHETVRPGAVKKRDLHGVDWFEVDGNWVQLDEPWEAPRTDGHGGGHGGHHGGLDLDPAVMKEALNIIFGPEPAAPMIAADAAEAADRAQDEFERSMPGWFKVIDLPE